LRRWSNLNAGVCSAICGGKTNDTNTANYAFVGAGLTNTISNDADYGSIVGGANNSISPARTYCFIGGGSGHSISGNYGFIGGGYQNTINNVITYAAIAGGYDNEIASLYGAIGGGRENTIETSSNYSFIGGGYQNSATGTAAVIAGGQANTTDANFSHIDGGYQAVTSRYGERAQASGRFAADGDCQNGELSIRRQVTHSTAGWWTLYADGNTGTELLTVPTDAVLTFDVLISGITQGAAETFAFRIEGCIVNDGGTTALKGTPTVTVIDNSDDTDFAAQAVADNANDALLIQVRDAAGDSNLNVRWGGNVRWQSTTFPA